MVWNGSMQTLCKMSASVFITWTGMKSRAVKHVRLAANTSLLEANLLKAVFTARSFTQRVELHGLGSKADRTFRALGTEIRVGLE